MLNSINVIEGIKSFALGTNFLAAVSQDLKQLSLFNLDELSLISSWKSKTTLQEVHVNDDIAWCNSAEDYHGVVFFNGNFSFYDSSITKWCLREQGILIQYELINDSGGGTQKRINNTVKWRIDEEIFVYFISKNYLFFRHSSHTNLVAIDTDTSQSIWTKTFPEKIIRFIGQHQDILWVALRSGQIVGVDMLTGMEKVNLFNPQQHKRNTGQYAQIDHQSNKLFGLRGWYYWEIDLTNPTENYELYDLESHFKTFQMEANMPGYTFPFSGNRVFFGSVDRRGPTIGVFDRQQHQIVGTSGDATTNSYLPSVRQMAYQDKRLYVLDGSNRLHVFSCN